MTICCPIVGTRGSSSDCGSPKRPLPLPPLPTLSERREAAAIRSANFSIIATDEKGMLGVHSEGITGAAGKLQHAGFISYRRGHIAVLDQAGLEARVCECYAVVKTELNRLMSDVRYARASLPAAGKRIEPAVALALDTRR